MNRLTLLFYPVDPLEASPSTEQPRRRNGMQRGWLRGVVLGVALGTLAASNAPAATFVVNAPDDTVDAVAGDGACDTGNQVSIGGATVAECTLRAAIEESNALAGPDVIEFDPQTPTNSGSTVLIRPVNALPTVTETVLIDGRTGPGYSPSGTPTIQLSGSLASGSTSGLVFDGPGAAFSAVYALGFAGFPGDGVRVTSGADDFRMHSCHFGIISGFFSSGNGDDALELLSVDRARIGPPYLPCCGEDGTPNVIAASGDNGIEIIGDDNVIARNYIGTNRFGTATSSGTNQYGNTNAGILIRGGAANRIGVIGSDFEDDGFPRGNLISGSGQAGLEIRFGATETVVLANRIGTDLDGETALPNDTGIRIDGQPTRIGSERGGGNLVSGNTTQGIEVGSGGLVDLDVTIVGNRIGVDESATAPLGNFRGIEIDGANGVVVRANVIGGNSRSGIYLIEALDARIESNWIGTNERGANLGNTEDGVDCALAICRVGGPTLAQGNTIAFNGEEGVVVGGDGSEVLHNYIGTNASGTPTGNGRWGISVSTAEDVEIRGNVIGANEKGIRTFGAPGLDVQGNFIGVDRSGNPIPNLDHGIELGSSSSLRIGVEGSKAAVSEAANTIANNGGAGVFLRDFGQDPVDVTIRGNSIHGNTDGAILLGTLGGTPNDPGDADTGPNALQNAPVIDAGATSYDDVSQTLTVRYRVDSDPANSIYPLRVDFYTEDGRFWVGQDTYPATVAGMDRTTTIDVPALGFPATTLLRATATDGDGGGSTSELGTAVTVTVPEPTPMFSMPVLGLFWLASRRRGADR